MQPMARLPCIIEVRALIYTLLCQVAAIFSFIFVFYCMVLNEVPLLGNVSYYQKLFSRRTARKLLNSCHAFTKEGVIAYNKE